MGELMILAQSVADGAVWGVGGVGVTLLGLLIKRGVSGSFRIGNGNGDKNGNGKKLVEEPMCLLRHQELERRDNERHAELDRRDKERHEAVLAAIGEVKQSIRGVHERIDKYTAKK